MFKRPEEIIVLVLAVLWVVLTYFLAAFCGADAYTVMLITGLTLIWTAVCFRFWQKGWERKIWPVFLGSLVVCWWPMLDWLAVKDIIVPNSEAAAIVVAKPWYADWIFKSFLALLPVVAGYAFKWKRSRHVRNLAG